MKAQLIVTMVMWSVHPKGPYHPLLSGEETMATSVAKGMALNPEVRNPKWGRGSGWAQGQVILFFQGTFL